MLCLMSYTLKDNAIPTETFVRTHSSDTDFIEIQFLQNASFTWVTDLLGKLGVVEEIRKLLSDYNKSLLKYDLFVHYAENIIYYTESIMETMENQTYNTELYTIEGNSL